MTQQCPLCGGTVITNSAGDMVCQGCGETLTRKEIEAAWEEQEKDLQHK